MPVSTKIQVAGNVNGSIVAGDNNFVVNTNNGTIVYKQAAPQVRLRQFSPKPPRPLRGFVNRSDELAKLETWISSGETIFIYASDGMGKTSLLRQIANSAPGLAMPNGVILLESLDVDGQALGSTDIIQCMFDALFESDPALKVGGTSARTYLSNTRPLILMDELPVTATLLRALPDFFPQGAIIITSDLISRGEFQRLEIGPLPRKEAISLLANRVGIQINDETHHTLDLLCAWLGDISLAIIICANVIRELDVTPDDVLQEILQISTTEVTPPSELERVFTYAFTKLNPQEKKILSTAALTPGISMTPEWLSTALGGVDSAPFMDRLKAMGLLFTNSPRLRLPPGLQSIARRAAVVEEQVVLSRLAEYLLAEAENNLQNWEFFKNELGNLIGTLAWAVRTKNWEIAMRLARALDPYLSLHGLWDAWLEVLNTMLSASSQMGDQTAEAWALHQLGTREIGLGTRQQALEFLQRALEIRRRLGDTIGMAYTQHNINLLIGPLSPPRGNEPKPPFPPKSPHQGVKRLLRMGVIGMAGCLGIVLLAILIGVLVQRSRPPTATQAPIIPPSVVTLTRQPKTVTPVPPTDKPRPGITSPYTPTRTRTATPTLTPTPPSGSGQIVFTLLENTLFAENVDGSNLHEVGTDFNSAKEPAWSPDGQRIAFVHFDDRIGFNRIYTVNANGSNLQQIDAEGSINNISHPTWSPDGKQIAFLLTYSDFDGSELYALNLDTGQFQDLTHSDGTGHYDYPEWSPDGKQITYHAFVDNNWELFVMNSDGSNQRRLTYATNPAEEWSIQPSWSPNSRQLAFASNRTGNWEIYMMSADGSNVRQLTKDDFYDTYPDWSPDGNLIAFTSDRNGGTLQIYIMVVDDARITQLTNMSGNSSEADWLP